MGMLKRLLGASALAIAISVPIAVLLDYALSPYIPEEILGVLTFFIGMVVGLVCVQVVGE